MKKTLFAGLSLLGALLPNLQATWYGFEDFETTLLNQAGEAHTVAFQLEFGGFSHGFTPTLFNRDEWLAHWVSEPGGYYDPSGPEWSATLALGDNSTLDVGAQLYLWVFDSLAGASAQQALFFDSAWKMSLNNPADNEGNLFSFSEQSEAVVGVYNFADQSAFTAPIIGSSAVPEPGTYGLMAGLGLAAVCTYRRYVKGGS